MIYKIEIEREHKDGWFDASIHWRVEVEDGEYYGGEQEWKHVAGGYIYTIRTAKRKALKAVLSYDKDASELGIIFAATGTAKELKESLS